VAAMPSVGLKMKLSVLGVAMAALGVSTSSASASDVWLWACHGPAGAGIGNSLGNTNFEPFNGGCATPSSDLDSGLRGDLTPVGGKITYGDNVSASLTVPPNTKLTGLRLQRRATGVVTGVEYSATALNAVLPAESKSGADVAADDKSFTIDPGSTVGGNVLLKLICAPTTGCPAAAPALLDVSRVGLKVTEAGDAVGPTFAVGGTRSPAAGTLDLDVRANDPGVGLQWAQAYIEGTAPPAPTRFAASNCDELTPGDATIDLPLDNDCPHVSNVGVSVNTNTPATPDATNYTLVVRVADWAGNVTEQRSTVEVANNVNLGTNTQTLSIGTSGSTTPNVVANTNTTSQGGVAGSSSQNCNTPRLSFSLSQKPMRISKGVPVLQSGKRYRFNGRLTCVINGKRRSAPKRARVDITNKVGKKTLDKAGTTVRDNGKLTVILAYKSSRTITFRFTNSDGKRSQVSIKVKVEKKKKSTR
jgi:hypothetical protein